MIMKNQIFKFFVFLFVSSLTSTTLISCGDDDSNGYSSSVNTNGHDYVDLGLSVVWATCNIGAAEPWAYGEWFYWGATKTGENPYYLNTGDGPVASKYNDIDGKTQLDFSDDAARVNWGGQWRIPTRGELVELGSKCLWCWTVSYKEHKVGGFIVFKAKSEGDKGRIEYYGETPGYSVDNDPHIFLPAASNSYNGTGEGHRDHYGEYMSSTGFSEGYKNRGDFYSLSFGCSYYSGELNLYYPLYDNEGTPREVSCSIRPVLSK